jgi:hypothetical protein
MATQAGSALWLVLAGVQYRATAVIFKAEVVRGQFSVVLSKEAKSS